MREKSKEQTSLIKSTGITLGISLLLSFTVMLITSWAVSSGNLSTNSMSMSPVIACGVGAFIMGMGGVAFIKKKALLTGITAGLAYFLLIYLVGTLVYFRAVPEASPVTGMLLASLAGGLVAGLLGRRKKKQSH